MFRFYIEKNKDPRTYRDENGQYVFRRFRFPFKIRRRPGLESKADAGHFEHALTRIARLEKSNRIQRELIDELLEEKKARNVGDSVRDSILVSILEKSALCCSNSDFFLERLNEMHPEWGQLDEQFLPEDKTVSVSEL